MISDTVRRLAYVCLMIWTVVLAGGPASALPVTSGAPVPVSSTPLRIIGLQTKDGIDIAVHPGPGTKISVGLNGDVAVVVNAAAPLDASHYVLFLNGHEIEGLDQTYYDPNLHALVFHLERNAKNAGAWAALLGEPTSLVEEATVALGEHPAGDVPATPSITGPKGLAFRFQVLSVWKLLFAFAAVAAMLIFVWGGARRTTIMKDSQIPQIDAKNQTYSLGRWQMAIWLSLIFSSYVFLCIVLGDVNTLSSQALMLMGISGATALAAIAVDVAKDSPQDAVNQGLRLLGIKDYTDVVRIKMEIADRQAQLKTLVSPEIAAQLQSEISDRMLLLRTYNEAIAPFLSEGWLKDISTDQNGPALHRVQVVCWTLLLGAIFVVGVWSNLAMPEFSNTLLALMGVSGAGYVGFKYPEAGQ